MNNIIGTFNFVNHKHFEMLASEAQVPFNLQHAIGNPQRTWLEGLHAAEIFDNQPKLEEN